MQAGKDGWLESCVSCNADIAKTYKVLYEQGEGVSDVQIVGPLWPGRPRRAPSAA